VDTGLDFGGVQPRFVMVLDLKASLDRLLKEMKSKTRYNIRYGERRGVRVFYGREKKDLAVFYDLLTETAERDNFTIRPFSYFQALRQHLINNQLGPTFFSLPRKHASGRRHLLSFRQKSLVRLRRFGKPKAQPAGFTSSAVGNDQVGQRLGLHRLRFSWGSPAILTPKTPYTAYIVLRKGMGAKLCEYVGEFDLPIRAGGYTLWRGGLWAHNWLRKKRQKT